MSSHIVLEEPKMNTAEDSEKATRRAFLVAAGAAGLCYTAALAYPIYRYLASPEEMASSATAVKEVSLRDAQKLPAGSVLMFKFGTSPAMLIHHADGTWASLSAVCTHLGCTVQYEPHLDRIHCACHGGVYNAYTGANVSALRKPYVIGRWMYSNGVRVPYVNRINAQGYLADSNWVWNGSASSYSRGEAIFRGECGSCHTLQGYRPLAHLLEGRDCANIHNFIVMLHENKADSPYRKFMPPMVGTEQDVSDLTDFLNAQVNLAPPSAQKPLLTAQK